MGGTRRFCVQCGRELKPDLRFCVGCGHVVFDDSEPGTARPGNDQAASGHRYEATSTTPELFRDDTIAPAPPPDEPIWPLKGSYQPTETASGLAPPGFPAPPEELPPPVQLAPRLEPPEPPPDDFTRPPGRPSPGRPGPRARRAAAPLRPRRPTARPPRSRRPLVMVLTVLLAAGVAGAVTFFLLGRSPAAKPAAGATQSASHQASAQATAQATTASPSVSSPSASPSPVISERQAASNLAGLLAQSVKDRSSITAAVKDVMGCGPTLSQDPQTFQNAATSRQQLLSQLANLPGQSALPAGVVHSLTSAWQASVAADQDLGKWAQDEATQGCSSNDQSDPNFQAAAGPDGQATTEKKAFVIQWDPLASQYGLTTYQWNQL